jgi:hypothetical protein
MMETKDRFLRFVVIAALVLVAGFGLAIHLYA